MKEPSVDNRVSPDASINNGPGSDIGSNSKFNMTGYPSVYAKMLMTGMSSLGVEGAQTHMM